MDIKKMFRLFTQKFILITKSAFCRYWHWHRTVSLVVLITFCISSASSAMALGQTTDDPHTKEKVKVSVIGKVINEVASAFVLSIFRANNNILPRLEHWFNQHPEVLEGADRIAHDVANNHFVGHVEKVAEEVATDVLKKDPGAAEELRDISDNISEQVKDYPLDDGMLAELKESLGNKTEDMDAEGGSELYKYVDKSLGLAFSFLRVLGFNEELLNTSGFIESFIRAFNNKFFESSIKGIGSRNPYVKQMGIRALCAILAITPAEHLLEIENPNNVVAGWLGKAIALEVYSNRQGVTEHSKEVVKYIRAKIVGRVVDKMLKGNSSPDGKSKSGFVQKFVNGFIVGYYELFALSITYDACAVYGMTIEKFFAALPVKEVASQATNMAAVSVAACRWERYNIGMKAQRDKFVQPTEPKYLCVSQLQEKGSSRVICDAAVHQDIKVKAGVDLHLYPNLDDGRERSIIDAILGRISILFKPFLTAVEDGVVGKVLEGKLNAFTLGDVEIVEGESNVSDGKAVLVLDSHVNKNIKITKINPDHNDGCVLVTQLPVTIAPNESAKFSFTGCRKDIHYALPTDYVVGNDDKTGEYLHGMIWFKVPSDSASLANGDGTLGARLIQPQAVQQVYEITSGPIATKPHVVIQQAYNVPALEGVTTLTGNLFSLPKVYVSDVIYGSVNKGGSALDKSYLDKAYLVGKKVMPVIEGSLAVAAAWFISEASGLSSYSGNALNWLF